MKTDTQVGVRAVAEPHQVSNSAAEICKPEDTADAAHAADNILQWTSYLPADCIKSMIFMGWDRST
jgi:hypothetical protein